MSEKRRQEKEGDDENRGEVGERTRALARKEKQGESARGDGGETRRRR